MKITTLTILAVLATAPAALAAQTPVQTAEPQTEQQPQQPQTSARRGDEQVCRTIRATGSRTNARRVCMSRSEAEALRAESRNATNRVQMNSVPTKSN